MGRAVNLVLWGAIAVMLAGVLSGGALAAPVFYTKAAVGETAGPVQFTGSVATLTWESSPARDKYVCKKGTGVGEVTGPTTIRRYTVVLTECEGAELKCHTPGAGPDEIIVSGLQGTLGALSPIKAGLRLEEEGGGQLAFVECGGDVLEVSIEGAFYGEITGVPAATSVAAARLPASLTLVDAERNGIQKYVRFEGEAGEEQLNGTVNGKNEKQGVSATTKLVSDPSGDLGVIQ